ncbi:MAG: transglutaminase domain-containing protein [Bacteroidia bacterium]|jgi:hypothetical protein
MKRIIIITAFLFATNAAYSNKNNWVNIESEIKDAYIVNQTRQSIELVRIYKNNVYEHIKYSQKSNKTYAERHVGTYTISEDKITFVKPAKKAFNGYFVFKAYHYKQRKIYASAFDMHFRPKKEAFSRTQKVNYLKPFFLCIESDDIIYNKEASDSLDLKELVNYLVKDKKNEQEKADALIKFITGAIEYDWDGYQGKEYAHKQNDINGILTGEKRLAVCAGYANMFARFCELAGLNGGEVIGYTKQKFNDLMKLGGYHAWNWIEIEGKKQLLDVTWADNGKNTVDRQWINVDPQIMLGTHFPDSVKYQFLEKPLTREVFLNAPVITPLMAGVKALDVNVSAYTMANQSYTVSIPGIHKISYSISPEEYIYTVYSGEAERTVGSTARINGDTFYKNDSTFIRFELEQTVNLINLTIDSEMDIKFVMVKNGVNGLMSYYMHNANFEHGLPFVKGIAAAIKTQDASTLKKLVGEKHEQFFDAKGKLKLKPELTEACSNWIGETTEIYKIHHTTSYNKSGQPAEKKEEIKYSILIGGKVRFHLNYDGVKFALKSYQIVDPKNKCFF